MNYRRLLDRARNLPLVKETSHFSIHYGLRNSTGSRGLGCDGVRSQEIVERYGRALERLYRMMTSPPWNRPQPVVGSSGKIDVYLLDIGHPFSTTDWQSPYIILPSSNSEVTTRLEILRAEAEAVHEATHVFNFRERPYLPSHPEWWTWFDEQRARLWACFDEGLALYLETKVYPRNLDHFRFLKDWVTSPDISLDDHAAYYHFWIFIHFLSQKFGEDFVNDVWMQSEPDETPYQTINRLLAGRPQVSELVSSSKDRLELLLSYNGDAYFLCDQLSGCYLPQVYKRFSLRAALECLALKLGQQTTAENQIDHLACHYYQIRPEPGVVTVRVELQTNPLSPIKAEVAIVTNRLRKGDSNILRSTDGHESTKMVAELNIPGHQKTDHIILILSNCGVRSATKDPNRPHDDEQGYKLSFFAE